MTLACSCYHLLNRYFSLVSIFCSGRQLERSHAPDDAGPSARRSHRTIRPSPQLLVGKRQSEFVLGSTPPSTSPPAKGGSDRSQQTSYSALAFDGQNESAKVDAINISLWGAVAPALSESRLGSLVGLGNFIKSLCPTAAEFSSRRRRRTFARHPETDLSPPQSV